VTATDLVMDPPAPVHVRTNVELTVSIMLTSLPLNAFSPVHAPLAWQLVALVDDHESVVVAP
jgi:hypothetical protein